MPRRFLVAVILAVFGLTMTLIAALTPRLAFADAGDYAVGGGFQDLPAGRQHFAFAAHDNGPNPPTGHVTVWQDTTAGRLFLIGDVTCIRVLANSAEIGFVITKSNVSFGPVGSFGLFNVTDNGQPVMSQPVDTMTDVFVGFGSALPCTVGLPGAILISSGNIVVHDPSLVTDLLGCPAISDGVSYQIDSSCNVFVPDDSGSWTLVQ